MNGAVQMFLSLRSRESLRCAKKRFETDGCSNIFEQYIIPYREKGHTCRLSSRLPRCLWGVDNGGRRARDGHPRGSETPSHARFLVRQSRKIPGSRLFARSCFVSPPPGRAERTSPAFSPRRREKGYSVVSHRSLPSLAAYLLG